MDKLKYIAYGIGLGVFLAVPVITVYFFASLIIQAIFG
jgi:hypothetical protein